MSPGAPKRRPLHIARGFLFALTWCFVLPISCSGDGSSFGSDIPIIGLNDKGVANPNNRPPVLKHIGDRTVAVGETLTIFVEGFDPDSDTLSFAVFGNLPEGAKFEKNEGRFDWTPVSAQAPVFLTFQVSDGFENDRETIKITTTLQKQNLPPVFQKVDDQVVIAGTNYSFQLEATDPNGDELLYGAQGSLPDGSQLVPELGLFQWNVPSHMVGSTVLVVFTVSDGLESALMEVRFVVSLDGTGPSPPVFDPIESLEVEAGKILSHEIKATDPNGETIVFNLQGTIPPGLTLHPTSGILTWTPALSDAGKTFTITVVATDGSFNVFLDLNISVYAPGTNVGNCTDDTFELNNTAEQAALVQPGNLSGLSLCDTASSPADEDWFAIQLTPGVEFTATVTWNASGQGLNLQLARATDFGVAYMSVGQGDPGQRTVSHVVTETGTYYVIVFGVDTNKYSEEYDLAMSLSNPSIECVQDTYEFGGGNDTAMNAFFLSTGFGPNTMSGLTICPGDEDWFEFTGICGQNATVSIDFDTSKVDLDLYLYEGTNAVNAIKQSAGVLETEEVSLSPINKTSTYLARVKGFPSSAQGDYELTVNIADGPTCFDDGNEPNDSQLQAIPIESGVPLVNQKLCCNEDFFQAQVQTGQNIEVTVVFNGSAGTVDLISGSLGSTVATQSATAVTVNWVATTGGPVYIRVHGADIGTTYSLEATYSSSGSSLCTNLTCPQSQICDPNSGCVSDFCLNHNQCPQNHLCTENKCVNACSGNNDCRIGLGYQCKTLMGAKYCAQAGDEGPGGPCDSFTDCSGAAACMLLAFGGYCAVNNCWADSDCPSMTYCYAQGEFSGYCAQSCFIDLDCRTDEGYSCTLISAFAGTQKWACIH